MLRLLAALIGLVIFSPATAPNTHMLQIIALAAPLLTKTHTVTGTSTITTDSTTTATSTAETTPTETS